MFVVLILICGVSPRIQSNQPEWDEHQRAVQQGVPFLEAVCTHYVAVRVHSIFESTCLLLSEDDDSEVTKTYPLHEKHVLSCEMGLLRRNNTPIPCSPALLFIALLFNSIVVSSDENVFAIIVWYSESVLTQRYPLLISFETIGIR